MGNNKREREKSKNKKILNFILAFAFVLLLISAICWLFILNSSAAGIYAGDTNPQDLILNIFVGG